MGEPEHIGPIVERVMNAVSKPGDCASCSTRHPISRCRSCQASVIFAKTTKGSTGIFDATAKPDGTVTFVIVDGLAQRAPAGQAGHESHFVSCPNRAFWRKEKPKEKKA